LGAGGKGRGKPDICPPHGLFKKLKKKKQILTPKIKRVFSILFFYPEYRSVKTEQVSLYLYSGGARF
jgi:hypothetical protein